MRGINATGVKDKISCSLFIGFFLSLIFDHVMFPGHILENSFAWWFLFALHSNPQSKFFERKRKKKAPINSTISPERRVLTGNLYVDKWTMRQISARDQVQATITCDVILDI